MAKDFNKDLDKYLSTRRDTKRGFFSSKKSDEKVPDLNEHEVTIEERPTFWTRLFGGQKPIDEDLTPEEQLKLEAMEQEIEAVEAAEEFAQTPEEAEMLEDVRQGMLARFFERFRFFEARHELNDEAEAVLEAEEELEEERALMREDVKSVLKITHKWLGKLSKRQKDAFKDSDDFNEYCRVLEEYGVAKKKK